MKFGTHGVCLSKKTKQTHCGSHNKAWYLSGVMMSFMASDDVIYGGLGFDIIYVQT